MRIKMMFKSLVLAFGLAGCSDSEQGPGLLGIELNSRTTTDPASSEASEVISAYGEVLATDAGLTLTGDTVVAKQIKMCQKLLRKRLRLAKILTSTDQSKIYTAANAAIIPACKEAGMEISAALQAKLGLVACSKQTCTDEEFTSSLEANFESAQIPADQKDAFMAEFLPEYMAGAPDQNVGAVAEAVAVLAEIIGTSPDTAITEMAKHARSEDFLSKMMAGTAEVMTELGFSPDQVSSVLAAVQESPTFKNSRQQDSLLSVLQNVGRLASATTSVTADDVAVVAAAVATTATPTVGSPSLALVSDTLTLNIGVAMTPEDPASGTLNPGTNATIKRCAIDPQLPAGLSLNTTNCKISGTPTALSALATYTMTLTNSGELVATDTIAISVIGATPSVSYSSSTLNLSKDVAMTAETPTVSAGALGSPTITGWSVSPSLPAGLSLSASGVLSGTPTAVSASAVYTFTATNSHTNTSSDTITITVADDLTDNSAANFAGGTMVGVEYASGKLILDIDTDCDGIRNEGESVATNCNGFNASWAPKYSNIVSYYPFDGDYVDEISGTLTLTTTSTSFQTANPKVGSGALQITGDNNAAAVPTSPAGFDVEAGDFAFSLWFMRTGGTSGGNRKLTVWKPTSGGTDWRFNYTDINTDEAKIELKIGAGGSSFGDHPFPKDRWSHFVYSRVSGTGYVYLNGRLYGTMADTTNFSDEYDNGDPIFLGSTHNGDGSTISGNYAWGYMDEWAFWNTSLTSDDVKVIYDRQRGAQAGTFTSRVFDAGATNAWDGIAWTSSLPFNKPLVGDIDGDDDATDEDEIATAYSDLVGVSGATSAANIDLQTGLIAYYSMDGTVGAVADSSTVTDDAGAYDLTSYGDVSRVPGVLGQAIKLEGSDDYLQRGDFLGSPTTLTMSFWYNGTSTGTQHNKVVWIGGIGFGMHDAELEGIYYGSAFRVWIANNTYTRGGGWYHVVLVVDPSSSTQKMYLNGAEIESATNSDAISYLANHYLTIGGRNQGSVDEEYTGLVDEVAFWNRALHADEITQLYRRVANRSLIQVRQCLNSDCSDNPTWLGSTGTNLSYFSEEFNATVSAPSITFSNFPSYSGLTRRYFQYRIKMESESSSTTPDVKDLTVSP